MMNIHSLTSQISNKCIDCGSLNIGTVFVRSPKDNNIVEIVKEQGQVAPADDRYVIQRCKDCDSIFLHPYYFEESLAVYQTDRYNKGYFPNNIHTGGGPRIGKSLFPSISRWRNSQAARTFLRQAGFASVKNVRVFDIGCAKGDLVQGFADQGCDAHGVDVSDTVISQAQKRGLNVSLGLFEELDLADSSLDLIVSIQAFEHMLSLDSILREVKRTLKPDGKLIICIPNDIEGYRRYAYPWIWWIIPPMHVRYYTARNIETIFGRHGFKVVGSSTLGSVGGDIASILSWLLKKTPIRSIVNSRVYRLFSMGAEALFLPIDLLLNLAKVHSERVVILRK